MPLEFLISALVTLLVVVDPIGLVPSYLAVTHGLPQRARRSVALHATLIAAAILVGSALIGDWLLRTLSIGLPAFRIAGGLLLFSIASENGVRGANRTSIAASRTGRRRTRAQHRRLPACHSLDGRTWRDHCDHSSGKPQRRRQHAPSDPVRGHRYRSGALPRRLCARGANRQAARRHREHCRFTSARCSACGARGAIRRRRRTRRIDGLMIARE